MRRAWWLVLLCMLPWCAALRLYTDGAGFAYNHNGLWPPIWKRHIVLMIERRI